MQLSSTQIEKLDSFRIIINSLWSELEDVKYDIELELIKTPNKSKAKTKKITTLEYIEKTLNSLNETENYLTIITSSHIKTKIH